MKRYIKILFHLLVFQTKYFFAYRTNALLRFFHFPSYVLGSYLVIAITYNSTNSVFGWNKNEAIILFLVYQLMLALSYIFYFDGGVRNFLYSAVRLGQFDFVLTKPINSQFLAMFGQPKVDGLSSILTIIGLIFWFKPFLNINIGGWLNVGLFVIFLIIGFISYYLFCSSVATSALYYTTSGEVAEIMNKFEEAGQRPMMIYPTPMYWAALTIVPFGLTAYLPVAILLGKAQSWEIILALSTLPLSFLVNQYLWRVGIKRYSSASS